jgi:sigma-54 dependent transcriptional regulator, acetoin dehydrogenase operon transcriptional activator AcoR
MNTLLPHANSAQRLAQIERARQMVLHGQEDGAPAWVTPVIAQSWRRCLNLGHRPHHRVAFNTVSTAAMARATEASRQLLEAASPVVRSLSRAMLHTRYFAILTDAHGTVIDVQGPVDRQNRHVAAIARVGVDLSEASVGTTAIGTTLTDHQPVWLHRGEHFFEDTSVFSCAGAPIWGPDGRCVGMLDLTGVDVAEQPALKHLVTQSARSIENALTLALPHALMLRLNWPGRLLGDENDGLICLDGDGMITGANRTATEMLGSALATGSHCSQWFAMAEDALFDAARRQRGPVEVPLWSGLRLQVLAQLFAHGQTTARQRSAHSVPLKDIETALIRKAVDDARGNVMEAARALGISRATIYRKLRSPQGHKD